MRRTAVAIAFLGSCGSKPAPAPLPPCDTPDPASAITSAHGSIHQFVVSRWLVPATKVDFSIDLNGDRRVDNQLGNLDGDLRAFGFDMQPTVDTSVASGSELWLLTVETTDPSLGSDPTTATTLFRAQYEERPDFTGHGHFAVNTSWPSSTFFGSLAAGTFHSNDPINRGAPPVSASFELEAFDGVAPAPLPLIGAHVVFTTNGDGTLSGALQGSLREETFHERDLPILAAFFTHLIQTDPANHPDLIKYFDVGNGNESPCAADADCDVAGISPCVSGHCGCVNRDGTASVAGDGVIGVCELEDDPLFANLIIPDVQIFDATGAYAPSCANSMKDSLSVGIGFTAVPATF